MLSSTSSMFYEMGIVTKLKGVLIRIREVNTFKGSGHVDMENGYV